MGGKVGAGEFLWLFLGLRGRISRAAFFLGVLLLNLLVAYPVYRAAQLPEADPDFAYWIGIASIVILPALWSILALSVKRVHDFGKPGPLGVLVVVPMVNLLAFAAFCIVAGDPGPNAYARTTNSRD